MSNYDIEAKERWGDTVAHQEYQKKTVDYTQEKWQQVNDGLQAVFGKFSSCMNSGHTADSDNAQALVKELQAYITENYYTCTNEILVSLGQMYICDERFKNNIDSHGEGTAEFVAEAIEIYCKK